MKQPRIWPYKFRKANDTWLEKTVKISANALPLILIILFINMRINDAKFSVKKCSIEKKLAFSGIISKYQTDVFKEESTFLLNDSIYITIPRSSKELMLNDGDSIWKPRDVNFYITRSWFNDGKIDTVSFDCTSD